MSQGKGQGWGQAGALQTFQRDGKTKEVVFLENDRAVQMPADLQGTDLKPPLPVHGLSWAQLDNRGPFHGYFSLKYSQFCQGVTLLWTFLMRTRSSLTSIKICLLFDIT